MALLISQISCKCEYEPVLGLQKHSQQDQVKAYDLNNIFYSVLKMIGLIKKENFKTIETDMIWTAGGDISCSLIGAGADLQSLPIRNNSLSDIALLTSSLIIHNKILIVGQQTSTLVEHSDLNTLLAHLNMENRVNMNANMVLVVKTVNNKQILTNFNQDDKRGNMCYVNADILAIQDIGTKLLIDLEVVFRKVMKIDFLFDEIMDLDSFQACLGLRELTFVTLLGQPSSKFDRCLQDFISQTETKQTRTVLSYLLGDQQQIDSLALDINKALEIYNTNFKKLKTFDDSLELKYSQITTAMKKLSSHEIFIRDTLLLTQVEVQLQRKKQSFFNTKLLHLMKLNNLVHESLVHEQLEMIQRSILRQPLCSLTYCESTIFSTVEQDTILVHAVIVNLLPDKAFLIQCEAISSTHISWLHNEIAVPAGPNSLVVSDMLIRKSDLSNNTLVNGNARRIKNHEILLDNFLLVGGSLQCLNTVQAFHVNKKLITCKAMEVLLLPIQFDLQMGEERFTHISLKARKLDNVGFINDLQTKGIDKYLVDREYQELAIYHPILDTLFLNEVGEISNGKISAMATSFMIIISIIICMICWKCPGLREKASQAFGVLIPKVISNCRLKHKNRQLRKELEKELSLLEQVKKVQRSKSYNDLPNQTVMASPGGPAFQVAAAQFHHPRMMSSKNVPIIPDSYVSISQPLPLRPATAPVRVTSPGMSAGLSVQGGTSAMVHK